MIWAILEFWVILALTVYGVGMSYICWQLRTDLARLKATHEAITGGKFPVTR
jgi:hypothetical protein